MDKTTEKQKIVKKIEDLHRLAAQYRGEIITGATNVETHLEMIIADYFTDGNKKKSKELKHCLLSHNMFSFNIKKNLFLFILKTKFPKTKIDGEDIDKIMNLRNLMAHGKLVFYHETLDEVINFDDNTITLYECKTTKNKIVSHPTKLTREFVAKENKRMLDLVTKLKEILKTIKAEKKSADT